VGARLVARMTDIPRLALPFRVVAGRAATIEQDSDGEVLQCVDTIVRYRPGDREAAPDFGVPDQAHRQGGADLVTVADRVELWEPRVHALATSLGLDVMGLAQRVQIRAGRTTSA
jgi:hypothetical protein